MWCAFYSWKFHFIITLNWLKCIKCRKVSIIFHWVYHLFIKLGLAIIWNYEGQSDHLLSSPWLNTPFIINLASFCLVGLQSLASSLTAESSAPALDLCAPRRICGCYVRESLGPCCPIYFLSSSPNSSHLPTSPVSSFVEKQSNNAFGAVLYEKITQHTSLSLYFFPLPSSFEFNFSHKNNL